MGRAIAKPIIPTDRFIGWDLGGAHLKLAQIDTSGQLIDVRQLPCPIWRGIEYLDRALEEASHAIQAEQPCHALTMTAELADIFTDRLQGVQALVEHFGAQVSVGRIRIFAGKAGWLATTEVKEHATSIASANWLASARYAARKCARGIVVDIGSTTTDIIEFRDGRIWYRGYSDGERLRTGELVYTGVLRTPVMAVVQWVPFEGEWQTLASEQFATLADVYQLTGQLAAVTPPVSFETADGAGREPLDCARRLARMVGCDVGTADLAQWRTLAHYIARRHLSLIREAVERMLSRGVESHDLPLIGAGVGRFRVRELAAHLGCQYIDFSELVEGAQELTNYAAVCAPAAALAYLAMSS